MSEELKPCPLTWAIQRLNSTPYSLTKDECVEVLRGLRDEIRALTLRPAAQAGEREAFEAWAKARGYDTGRDAVGGSYSSGDTYQAWFVWKGARESLPAQPAAQEEAVCVCPLQGCRARILPAAQATPSRDAREAEQRTRMQARLSAGKATADFDLPAPNDDTQQATPEPVGEVLQFPPMPEGWPARFRCDSCDGKGEIGELVSMGHFQPPERQTCPDCGGRGWASEEHAFNADHMREFAEAHALLTRPAPGVPEGWHMDREGDDVIVVRHQAVGLARATNPATSMHGQILFALCDDILQDRKSLAAAQAKGGE